MGQKGRARLGYFERKPQWTGYFKRFLPCSPIPALPAQINFHSSPQLTWDNFLSIRKLPQIPVNCILRLSILALAYHIASPTVSPRLSSLLLVLYIVAEVRTTEFCTQPQQLHCVILRYYSSRRSPLPVYFDFPYHRTSLLIGWNRTPHTKRFSLRDVTRLCKAGDLSCSTCRYRETDHRYLHESRPSQASDSSRVVSIGFKDRAKTGVASVLA